MSIFDIYIYLYLLCLSENAIWRIFHTNKTNKETENANYYGNVVGKRRGSCWCGPSNTATGRFLKKQWHPIIGTAVHTRGFLYRFRSQILHLHWLIVQWVSWTMLMFCKYSTRHRGTGMSAVRIGPARILRRANVPPPCWVFHATRLVLLGRSVYALMNRFFSFVQFWYFANTDTRDTKTNTPRGTCTPKRYIFPN